MATLCISLILYFMGSLTTFLLKNLYCCRLFLNQVELWPRDYYDCRDAHEKNTHRAHRAYSNLSSDINSLYGFNARMCSGKFIASWLLYRANVSSHSSGTVPLNVPVWRVEQFPFIISFSLSFITTIKFAMYHWTYTYTTDNTVCI